MCTHRIASHQPHMGIVDRVRIMGTFKECYVQGSSIIFLHRSIHINHTYEICVLWASIITQTKHTEIWSEQVTFWYLLPLILYKYNGNTLFEPAIDVKQLIYSSDLFHPHTPCQSELSVTGILGPDFHYTSIQVKWAKCIAKMLQQQRNNNHDHDDDNQRQRLIASDQSVHRFSYGAIDDDVIFFYKFIDYF